MTQIYEKATLLQQNIKAKWTQIKLAHYR